MDLRELQEREKALRLQKEKLQRELEEKKKKVQGSQVWGPLGVCAGLWAGEPWSSCSWGGSCLACLAPWGLAWG